MTFTFNRNYDDREQIAPFYDDFVRVYDEIEASGRYTYNDLFKGRISGLADATDVSPFHLAARYSK